MFKRIMSSLHAPSRRKRTPASGRGRLTLAIEALENRSLLTALPMASGMGVSEFGPTERGADFRTSVAEPTELEVGQAFLPGSQVAQNDDTTRVPVSPTLPALSGSAGESRASDRLPQSLSNKPADSLASVAATPRVSIQLVVVLDAEPVSQPSLVPVPEGMSVSAVNLPFRAFVETAPAVFPSFTLAEMAFAGNADDVAESSDTSSTEAESLLDTVIASCFYGALQSGPDIINANDAALYSLNDVAALDHDRWDDLDVFGDDDFIDIGDDVDELLERQLARIRKRVQTLDSYQHIEPSDPEYSENHRENNTRSSRRDTLPENGDERQSVRTGETTYTEPTSFHGAREGMVELSHYRGVASATLLGIPVSAGDVSVQGDRGVDRLKLDGALARYQTFEIVSQPRATSESNKTQSTEKSQPTGEMPKDDNA